MIVLWGRIAHNTIQFMISSISRGGDITGNEKDGISETTPFRMRNVYMDNCGWLMVC